MEPIKIHQYLICDKTKTREKRHSRICQEKEVCGWLRIDEEGMAQCDFMAKVDKRANSFKAKRKQKKEG